MSERFFDTNIVIDMLHNRPAAWAEVRNVARAVVQAVNSLRAGRLSQPDRQITAPRPK